MRLGVNNVLGPFADESRDTMQLMKSIMHSSPTTDAPFDPMEAKLLIEQLAVLKRHATDLEDTLRKYVKVEMQPARPDDLVELLFWNEGLQAQQSFTMPTAEQLHEDPATVAPEETNLRVELGKPEAVVTHNSTWCRCEWSLSPSTLGKWRTSHMMMQNYRVCVYCKKDKWWYVHCPECLVVDVGLGGSTRKCAKCDVALRWVCKICNASHTASNISKVRSEQRGPWKCFHVDHGKG